MAGDLFGDEAPAQPDHAAGPVPLAEKLRPKVLAEVVGQEHLTGPEGAIGRMVAAGHWRDYALALEPDVAVFAAFRRSAERPEVRIEKRPELRQRQGAFALISEHGVVLKRGQELQQVLALLERRLIKLVG